MLDKPVKNNKNSNLHSLQNGFYQTVNCYMMNRGLSAMRVCTCVNEFPKRM